MFYYYGRKKQIVKYYPPPNYDTIIEPFAGSAAYSLNDGNWKKKVILIEKDERVADIWKWLINDASAEDILNMEDLHIGDRTSKFLHIIHAVTKMAFKYKKIKVTPVLERNWEISRRYMANNLYKIKHWQIICGDFTVAPDIEATWFIDPPYKGASGQGYHYDSDLIDYNFLTEWVKQREGEVIFCEGENGDYLPFETLLELKGVAGKSSKEKIYYKSPFGSRSQQLSLISEPSNFIYLSK